MSRFLDGPVAGLALEHSRAPVYLRVVLSSGGEPDVLDQIDDEPRDDEDVFVYRQVSGTMVGPMHVGYRDGTNRSGWRASADYRHIDIDVVSECLRRAERWRVWVDQQVEGEVDV